jgi:hypothetical protein
LERWLKQRPTVRAQRALVDGRIRLEYDHCMNRRAIFFVRNSRDGCVDDAIERCEHALNRHRSDFLAAAFEDLIFSPDEGQQAVSIHAKAISGTQHSPLPSVKE